MESPQIEVTELPDDAFNAGLDQRSTDRLLLLPESWINAVEADAVYPSTTQSTLKLLQAAKIPAELALGTQQNLTLRENRSFEWVAPVLFVSQILFTQNPDVIALTLDQIGNYVSELGRGHKTVPTVKLKIAYSSSKKKKVREIKYTGPAAGLKDLPKTLAELAKDD